MKYKIHYANGMMSKHVFYFLSCVFCCFARSLTHILLSFHRKSFFFSTSYRNCVVSKPPSNSKYLNPSENFFQIGSEVFLNYGVKPFMIFWPQKTQSNSNHPNPSENFEMSLRGRVRDYTISVI